MIEEMILLFRMKNSSTTFKVEKIADDHHSGHADSDGDETETQSE
jgi:hypothetical protein